MNSQRRETATSYSPADLAAIACIAGLCIAFFWKMAFTNLILPRGDVLNYFYPYWAARHEALQAGRIPLWNPDIFMGVPFLANSQSGVLYPPNWAVAAVDTPTAIKASIVAHIVWAAIGAYIFARRRLDMGIQASAMAGIVFSLGGYLTSQIEHVNQLQGLAWLPWVFWLSDEAADGKPRYVVATAFALAFQLLAGHAQSAFISGIGLGIWALWKGVGRAREWFSLRNSQGFATLLSAALPVLFLAASACLAAGLSAAQLLPTIELANLSARGGGLSALDAVSFSWRPEVVGRSLLPSYAPEPLFTEYVAYCGVSALVLVLIGVRHNQGSWNYLGLMVMAGASFLLALGAYNPIYWFLVNLVPGFNLFRVPARWLVLWAFASAMLAARGLEMVIDDQPHSWALRPSVLVLVLLVISVLIGWSFLAGFASDEVLGAGRPLVFEVGLWLIALVLVVVAVALNSRRHQSWSPVVLTVVVCLELFFASQKLPFNRLSSAEIFRSKRPSINTLLAENSNAPVPDRFLSISDTRFDPGDLREMRAIFGPYLDEQALDDYITATKQKEIITPNQSMIWGIPSMDGFDGGILPTQSYIDYTSLFLSEDRLASDGRLREYLDGVPPARWLHRSNVRYVLTDKVYDAWSNGVYYDLQFAIPLKSQADRAVAIPLTVFEANAIGLVAHTEGASDLPDGIPIGLVIVTTTDGQAIRLPVALGQGIAEGQGIELAHTRPEPLGFYDAANPEVADFLAILPWDEPSSITTVEVLGSVGNRLELVVRGVTLIDQRNNTFVPTTLSEEGTRRLIYSADVKIYEDENTPQRAYLVCNPLIVTSPADALALLKTDVTSHTVVRDITSRPTECEGKGESGIVRITRYEPEVVELDVTTAADGVYLFLTDAWYPGWQATVDGILVPIYQADYLFRAIEVPAGQHNVTFTFTSRPLITGTVISSLSMAISLLGLLFLPQRMMSLGLSQPSSGQTG